MFRGTCFAYLLFFSSAVAQTQNDLADEMAECGYLASLAVEQLSNKPEHRALFEDVVRNVVDFTNLYYIMLNIQPSTTDGTITNEMMLKVASQGKLIHDRRTSSMSKKNALRLSNKVLNNCRSDLNAVYQKLDL